MKVKDIIKKVLIDFPNASTLEVIDLIDEFIELYSYEKSHFRAKYTIGTLSSETSISFPSNVLTIYNLYLDDEQLSLAPSSKQYHDYEVENSTGTYDCYINNRTIYFKSEQTGDLTADCVIKFSSVGDLEKDEEITLGRMTALVVALYCKYNLAVRYNRADWKILYDKFQTHYVNVNKRRDTVEDLVINPDETPV